MTELGKTVYSDFQACRHLLIALGDETRQTIITALMDNGNCKNGIRVGEITNATHLSRPAVSHHLKLLKDAGVVRINKVGTMNFYYLNIDVELIKLKNLVIHLDEFVKQRRGY